MALKALIFDVDGTLVNTETDGHLVAFNDAFETMGLDWHWSSELYDDLLCVTGGRERIKHYIERFHADKHYATRPDLITWIAQIHALKTQKFIAITKQGKMPLRCGVERLFNEAKSANITLAIATTTTYDNVATLIEHTLGVDYLNNFAVIAAGDMVKNKKPAGDIYTYALKKLNLNANECLAFEDSENGIISATNAGIRSIITTNEWTNNHLFDDALLIANQLGDKDQPMTVLGGQAIDIIQAQDTYIHIDLLKQIYANHC